MLKILEKPLPIEKLSFFQTVRNNLNHELPSVQNVKYINIILYQLYYHKSN